MGQSNILHEFFAAQRFEVDSYDLFLENFGAGFIRQQWLKMNFVKF